MYSIYVDTRKSMVFLELWGHEVIGGCERCWYYWVKNIKSVFIWYKINVLWSNFTCTIFIKSEHNILDTCNLYTVEIAAGTQSHTKYTGSLIK